MNPPPMANDGGIDWQRHAESLEARVKELEEKYKYVVQQLEQEAARVKELEAEVSGWIAEGDAKETHIQKLETSLKHSDEDYNRVEDENEQLRNDESHLRLQLADAERDVERLRASIDVQGEAWEAENERLLMEVGHCSYRKCPIQKDVFRGESTEG